MPKYMLLLHNSSTSAARNVAPGDIAKIVQEYKAWAERLGQEGKLVGGEKLADDAGRILRPGKNGSATVTDGPYAESKELMGGYFCINAPDYDAAVTIAQTSPHLKYGGNIEVRKVDFT